MALLFLGNKFQSFDDNGDPNADGTVEFFEVGTTTPKEVFNDKLLASSAGTVVTLDGNGIGTIFLSDSDYKVIVKNSAGAVQTNGSQDGGINPQSSASPSEFNLIKNGSYEDDIDNDGIPDDWLVEPYTGGTQTLDSSTQQHGAKSIKYTSGGSGGGFHTSKSFFPVSPNKLYLFGFSLKVSVATVRNLVQVKWYTSAKVLISTTAVYDESVNNPLVWTNKVFFVTAPATARYAKVEQYGAHSSNATAGSVWYDESSLNEIRQNINLGADIASASTVIIPDGIQYADITGTTAITLISSNENYVRLHFDGILTLTHHATNLILPGGVNITTAAGDEAEFIQYATDDWRCVNYQRINGIPTFSSQMGGEYIKLSDVKSSGVDGGTFTGGSWIARVLNTEDFDTGNNCSLSSNQFTLDAGTYIVRASGIGYTVDDHKTRIYNVTDSSVELIGTQGWAQVTNNKSAVSFVSGLITLAEQKKFQFEGRCDSTRSTDGYGRATAYGTSEIYAVVELWKVK